LKCTAVSVTDGGGDDDDEDDNNNIALQIFVVVK
jgi:hypothetical protein